MTGDTDGSFRSSPLPPESVEHPIAEDAAGVSIVVAVKDDLPRLRRLVERLAAAPPAGAELVIVDGGSTDGTSDWLRRLDCGGPLPIRWSSEPDGGIAAAWNRGVSRARGAWVLFLGADDAVLDDRAWRQVTSLLAALPAPCMIAVCPVAVVSPSGRLLATERLPQGRLSGQAVARSGVPHQGAFHRRSCWSRFGPFDTTFRVAADYEFCLRVCREGGLIEALAAGPVVAMTFGGLSKRDPLANLAELGRARRTHGMSMPIGRWLAEWVRAIVRLCGMRVLPAGAVAWCADVARRARGLPPVWTVP